MPFRLPPLSALRFFEAAGRHQSFKLAAEELNVTPSAVSHGIVALERALGVTLFLREPRKLSLTPEGADYLPYIAEALSLIATGTQRLPGRLTHRVITVSCAPTFASRWLLPRLFRFKSRWPYASVAIDTSHRQVGFPVDGFDFAIRMSRMPLAGAAWTRLFGERLVPVCAPACRDRLTAADGHFQLHKATLIHVTSVSEDWQAWVDAAGFREIFGEIDVTRGLRLDTIQLAFEAAMAGLGVALGRRPLVDRDIASGSLIEVGPDVAAVETAYWLVSSDGAEHRPDLRNFKRWIVNESSSLDGRGLPTGEEHDSNRFS